MKEGLLIAQQRLFTARSVSGTDRRRAELPRALQRRNPLLDVTIADVVVGTIDADIAREEDPLLRKPCDCVSVSVRDSEVNQLNAMLSVVEDELLWKELLYRIVFQMDL